MSMDIKEIQNLVKFVAKSGVNEVSIEQGDFKITIKTEAEKQEQQYIVQAPPAVQAPVAPAVAAPSNAPAAPASSNDAPAAEENGNFITIKSPMIGTFYRSSGPDKDAYVSVGDSIGKGDTVCIIEAMKLFNEIESEISGKIVKVLVDDSSPVEYDQPLFLVDPA